MKRLCAFGFVVAVTLHAAAAAAATPGEIAPASLRLLGIPVDFILFAATLIGVGLFHHHTLAVALSGLAAITI